MNNNLKKYFDYIYLIFTRYAGVYPKYLVTKKMAKDFLISSHVESTSNYYSSVWGKKHDLTILTIGFNNWQVIRMQHENLKKYLLDNHDYVVVDNSTDRESCKSIRQYCINNDITYIRLENNPGNGRNPSFSHGISINWAYYNYLINKKSKYIGIIDHDIFPLKKTRILDNLKNQYIYGHCQNRAGRWYLWPGFCFYKLSYLKRNKPNFEPIWGLDSGGGNWSALYRHINTKNLHWPRHNYLKYQGGDTIQSSSVEIIDDWIHLMAASGWMSGNQAKDVESIMKLVKDRIKHS
jgi:hypothetical protein